MRPARDPIHARTTGPHLQVVLWLTVWTTTLTVDLINPLRALMVWAWVELLNTACFTTGTCGRPSVGALGRARAAVYAPVEPVHDGREVDARGRRDARRPAARCARFAGYNVGCE